MPYDNIKSHKKPGFHPFFRRYTFRKTTGEGEGGQIDPLPSVLGLIVILFLNENKTFCLVLILSFKEIKLSVY